MKNIFSKLAVAAVVGTGLTLGSCADELDLVNPNGFDASSFWVDQSLYEGNPIALANFFRSQTPNITFWAGELRAGSLSLNLINGSGVVNAEYIENLYDEAHTQYTVFGGYYGMVALLNQLIYQCNTQDGVITDNVKEGLLGLAKGWRAFCYFQMYKMYGGVPLRTILHSFTWLVLLPRKHSILSKKMFRNLLTILQIQHGCPRLLLPSITGTSMLH